MIVVYDLEQFANFHSCAAVDIHTKKQYYFEISDFRDDRIAYLQFLEECQGMIGFNNLSFDYPLLHWLLETGFKKRCSAGELARLAFKHTQKNIIGKRWSSIAFWRVKIPQRDLFKIHHFDNKAKLTSLKDLQVAMNWKNVKDLPFKFDHHVSYDETEEIKTYNFNDVFSTEEFYNKSLKIIKLRKRLMDTYNIRCMNWNDAKIGEQLFLVMLANKKGIDRKVLKQQRTQRDSIYLGDCLLPYQVKNKEIKKFVDYIRTKTITSTKGSINMRVLVDGMPYDFGTGGIHGCKHPSVHRPPKGFVIMSSDVNSYYPNLSIQYGFYPQHLGYDYCEVYNDIYQLKLDAEKIGDKDQRSMAKLGLNAAYGKSGDQYSFLYDPQYTMTTTINGQIFLSDLSVTLQKAGFDPIMINTDGFEFYVAEDRVDEYKNICQQWMDETNLVLEHDQYKVIAIRDVNNYVGQFVSGEIKQKGAFEVNKQWHKDPSFKIIPMALENYFLGGEDPEQYIPRQSNIFDFCGRVKSNSGYKIHYHYLDGSREKIDVLQKTNRIYLSNKGGYLYKVKGDRQMGVYKGEKVTVFNEFEAKKDYDINYKWYIKEVRKIIELLEPKQISLF